MVVCIFLIRLRFAATLRVALRFGTSSGKGIGDPSIVLAGP
jgi:hypothetical protein